jgi:hypothetical protein
LKVLTITTLPLRDRREDIPVVAQHFVMRRASEMGRSIIGPQHLPDLRPIPNRAVTLHRRSAPEKPSPNMREHLEAALQESAGDCKTEALAF